MDNNKRTILAVVLSGVILLGFGFGTQYFGSNPAPVQESPRTFVPPTVKPVSEPAKTEQTATEASFVPLKGDAMTGRINLKGAVVDRLCLTKYAQTLDKNSPRVCVLDSADPAKSTIARIGWNVADGVVAPDLNTVWTASGTELTPNKPLQLSWSNEQGVRYQIDLTIDNDYLFTVKQSVFNSGGKALSLQPYQAVERNYKPEDDGSFTEYEGPIGVLDGRLKDDSYKTVRKDANAQGVSMQKESSGGWIGLTDKYWLTAFAVSQGRSVMGEFRFKDGIYQSVMQAPFETVGNDANATVQSYLFAGAKDYRLLEDYSRTLNVPELDKSIDFGWFAFLTRPILKLLHWLFVWTGNFGLALLALTLIVKIILFPLATKAARSQARMRLLTPKMKALRERYAKEPMVMNKKIMELYRAEKVNPASGCLPMLIQAPIFFCLYKMLNISLDERHAPFYGWIKDLSVPDPTNVLNLFGLLPFDPSGYASFLHISLWGLALGGTFWLVQKDTMVNVDPQQAKIMQWMPAFYVLFMSSFPAGLLIYYTWNNLLTYLQQVVIGRFTRLPVPENELPRDIR